MKDTGHWTVIGEHDPVTNNLVTFVECSNCKKRLKMSDLEDSRRCSFCGINMLVDYDAMGKDKEITNRALRIRKASGLTQAAFSAKYNIPKRSIENWEGGKSECPEYVLDLLERVVKEDFLQ